MSLHLRKGEICPHRTICPYNKYSMGSDSCWGARSERDCDFNCDYVIEGRIQEGFSRNPMDKTGQMKVLFD
jgi:hypothetical protein